MLLDLNSYEVNDFDSMFPLSYKQVARELATKLAVIFWHLVRGGSLADVVPIQKGSATSDVDDYRPSLITPVLSKVFEMIALVTSNVNYSECSLNKIYR